MPVYRAVHLKFRIPVLHTRDSLLTSGSASSCHTYLGLHMTLFLLQLVISGLVSRCKKSPLQLTSGLVSRCHIWAGVQMQKIPLQLTSGLVSRCKKSPLQHTSGHQRLVSRCKKNPLQHTSGLVSRCKLSQHTSGLVSRCSTLLGWCPCKCHILGPFVTGVICCSYTVTTCGPVSRCYMYPGPMSRCFWADVHVLQVSWVCRCSGDVGILWSTHLGRCPGVANTLPTLL